MYELLRVMTWMTTVLQATTAVTAIVGTRIYVAQVPQDAGFPHLRIADLSGLALNVIGPRRTHLAALVQVAAINEGLGLSTLGTLMDAVDTALQGADATSGGLRFNAVQDGQYLLRPDVVEGTVWLALAADYRVWARAAA